MKRVIAEMGGKDGVVVDETADLDRAAQDIVTSAFGFQGQKCSAGSRAIIVESVYEKVKEKVLDLTSKLTLGNAIENYQVGPVCDEVAFKNILNYIEIGKNEGTLLCGGKGNDEIGYFIEPTIFENIESHHRLFQEEIFGPVLTLTKAHDWKHAIELYNDTEYGLTGAFHTTIEERINDAYDTMNCGNLYINKKCTGALVGIHPFGGFNMSGTDSKAGGPDYLMQFVLAKATTRLSK
jgi:1-pyrroline-5-carboxylate dehydrogenase